MHKRRTSYMSSENNKFEHLTNEERLQHELKAAQEALAHYPNILKIQEKITQHEQELNDLENEWKIFYSRNLEKIQAEKNDLKKEELHERFIHEHKQFGISIEKKSSELKRWQQEKDKVDSLLTEIGLLNKKIVKIKMTTPEEVARLKSTEESNERWDAGKKIQPLLTKPVSLVSSLAAGTIVMDIAKGLVSPIDYLVKGLIAIRDFATTGTSTGQRKVKLGASLLIAGASFAYAGITATIAAHKYLGASVASAALGAIPIAAPILLVGIAGIGLAKDCYILYNMQKAIDAEENELKNKVHERSLLQQSDNPRDKAQLNRLTIQIQTHEINLQKMVAKKNYQQRRVVTGFFSMLGYIIAAFSLLFPPLLAVGACIVLGSAGVDAYDKYQLKSKKVVTSASLIKAASTVDEDTETTTPQESPAVIDNKKKISIQYELATQDLNPQHTPENQQKVKSFIQAELSPTAITSESDIPPKLAKEPSPTRKEGQPLIVKKGEEGEDDSEGESEHPHP